MASIHAGHVTLDVTSETTAYSVLQPQEVDGVSVPALARANPSLDM